MCIDVHYSLARTRNMRPAGLAHYCPGGKARQVGTSRISPHHIKNTPDRSAMRPPMQFGASARCAVVLPFGEKKTGRCLRYCFVFGDNLGMALSGGFFRFTTGLKVCNVRKVRQTGAPMYFTRPFKLPKPQRLHQKQDRDCGVSVFAALAGVSEEELLAEVPGADRGTVTVNGWCAWLERKGFTVTKRKGCPAEIFPCAHLVAKRATGGG